ncbi:uncharacterized protein EV422DRAFT_541111 [Fimicolochytrium jonesii]|uniref:uncharacterized protein n=1 Tax=Fimicolochytrium jonesii TaxID=1396493 RepID=UPI0022FE40C6|nr:uncharacterized protein EV422DRAFT_541111 [Fimicolochytrium jonesii]KAI8817551.1 hypothetical protein EV422DRAFT_541111 [Fimicolochytrium jonesii]
MSRAERDSLKELASALRAARGSSPSSPSSTPTRRRSTVSKNVNGSRCQASSPPKLSPLSTTTTAAAAAAEARISPPIPDPTPNVGRRFNNVPSSTVASPVRTVLLSEYTPSNNSTMGYMDSRYYKRSMPSLNSRRNSSTSNQSDSSPYSSTGSLSRRVSFGTNIVYAFDKTAASNERSGSVVNVSCGTAIATMRHEFFINSDPEFERDIMAD